MPAFLPDITTRTAALSKLADVEAELNQRWPETKIDPTLARMNALMDELGSPQRGYPAVHIAGTNGKTSVSRMIDALLTRLQWRTGRMTSPHLETVTERISVADAPISAERCVDTFQDITPFVRIVDDRSLAGGGPAMSTFEVLTAMGFVAFADAAVDVAVVEVGLGGTWDATNVIDGQVAVITPIATDHVDYLGSEITGIAKAKAGIVKPGSTAIVAEQSPEITETVLRRCNEVEAVVAREGAEFAVLARQAVAGGQWLRLRGLGGVYDDIFLPVHGAHQAQNAVLALAAVEAFLGAGLQLDVRAVREAFAAVTTPGRLERVRDAPTVFVDAAHNPHGAHALAATLKADLAVGTLVGVVAVLADKDAAGLLAALEPVFHRLVITSNDSPRAMAVEELAVHAAVHFGPERVVVAPTMAEALPIAIAMARDRTEPGQSSGAAVVVTGSVVTAAQARALLGAEVRPGGPSGD